MNVHECHVNSLNYLSTGKNIAIIMVIIIIIILVRVTYWSSFELLVPYPPQKNMFSPTQLNCTLPHIIFIGTTWEKQQYMEDVWESCVN